MLYRAVLRLTAPLGTPLTSGTVWGRLAGLIAEEEGDGPLARFLDPETIWAVSDGLPHDHLPRPELAPVPPPEARAAADTAKALKKRAHVTRAGFLATRGKLSATVLADHLRRWGDRSHRSAHNRIDRLTGTTPETGGLHFQDEEWGEVEGKVGAAGTIRPTPLRDLYIEAPADDAGRIGDLLARLGTAGFGRDANLGRGRWEVVSVEPDRALAEGPGQRRLSLSHGAAEGGIADLRCRLVTIYGRLGPDRALAGISPFKYPLLLTRPGATFRAVSGRPGQVLSGVHPDCPEVVQNALHLSVPFAEAPE